MKKSFGIIFTIFLVFSLLLGSLTGYAADWNDGTSGFSDDPSYWGSNYKTWSQGAAEYGNALNKYGCWVVAMSKLLMEVNAVPKVFNPGVFLRWEKENGYINSGFYQTNKGGSGYAPVAYAKLYGVTLTVDVYPGNMKEADMLKLLKDGKYLIVQVKSKPDHYVYVARDESLKAGKIYYWDSWTSLNKTDKRYKTVDKLSAYNRNDLGYKVYCVWAYGIKKKETKPATPQTTPQTTPPTTTTTPPPSNPTINPPVNPPAIQDYPPEPVKTPVTEGWILASNLPEGARVTERKWIYDITQYTESTNANLDGWILIGSEWRQSGIGSIEYANFPSGFDKNHEYYKLYNNSPFTAFENESTKREVTNTLSEYIYWHWTYEPGLPGSSVNNRYILDHQGYDSSTGFTFKYFHAFKDKNDYEYYSNLGVYKHNAGKFWSWWWFRIDLMKSTYTDYTKYYKYTRTVKTESNTYPSGTGISNVQEWVKYELPEQTNVPAPVIDPSVPLEDEAPRIILDPDYVRTCAYNGNGYNYFKLRDIAYLLLGTPAQFSVEYDSYSRAIILTSGDEYIPVGDELMGKSAPDSSATITNNLIIINGKRYVLKAYMIGGYNYFMLRDIASMLDFDVDWDSATGNIIIEPEQPYTPD